MHVPSSACAALAASTACANFPARWSARQWASCRLSEEGAIRTRLASSVGGVPPCGASCLHSSDVVYGR